MLPFRVILVDENRSSTVLLVSLVRAPDRGDHIDLPHGDPCVVRQVLSSDTNDVAGVIVAGVPSLALGPALSQQRHSTLATFPGARSQASGPGGSDAASTPVGKAVVNQLLTLSGIRSP